MEHPGTTSLNPDNLPLSLSQREVWLDQCARPDSTHLNIGGGGFIKGIFEQQTLIEALTDLVAESQALRLVPDHQGRQRLLPSYHPVLETLDLSDNTNPEESLQQWLKKSIAQPFFLGEAPPWRFALLKFNDQLAWLSIQFHHLVMDGWGTSQVMRRWVEIYNAKLTNSELPAAGDPGYLRFIEESLEYRAAKVFENDSEYWEKCLPVLPAPLFERRHRPTGHAGLTTAISSSLPISRSQYDRLSHQALSNGGTPFSYMIATLAFYFARVQHRQEIVIGIPSLNRGGKRFKNTFGMFVSVFPLALKINQQMTVLELLAYVSSELRAAVRHQRYPISEIGKRLQAIRHKRDSLFDVLFSFERQDYTLKFGETAESSGARQVFSGISRFPLSITLCEFHPDQDVELTLEASAAYFEPDEVNYLGHRLIHLMSAMLTDSTALLASIDFLPPAERLELTQGAFQGGYGQRAFKPYFYQFEQLVKTHPDTIALIWDEGHMSYGSLNVQANQIAQTLRKQGAGRDKIVALAVERSPEMVAAILGISKSGAAFLPLDVDAPLNRLARILDDSGAIALLIQTRNHDRFKALPLTKILLEDVSTQPSSALLYSAQTEPRPSDLAYVLFTSGSTGHPKGVMVEHQTIAMRLEWLVKTWAVTPADRTGHANQLTFDPSLIEILLPLTQGASIALAPPGRQHPNSLRQFAIRHAVTIMALVPATVRGIVDSNQPAVDLKLRVVCCGGEILPGELAQRFTTETRAQLYNVYGPTETAIFATAWRCQSPMTEEPLPVGFPVDESRIYILDASGHLLPFGALGEIHIAGRAIARGYLNRPELDAGAFQPDPFVPGQRMYRTGDLGWLGTDGNLHFQGRIDRQIKLRGYRIELGEIEASLLSVEQVTQAAAKLIEIQGKPVIYAWVAGLEDKHLPQLRETIATRLPDYMLPSGISLLTELPLNSTGKIDYDALPVPQTIASHLSSRPASGRLEIGLLNLWEKALNRQNIGVHDNFFDLGGDSIAAVEILTGIEQLLGRKISLFRLTEHPSIEQLAIALGDEEADGELMMALNCPTGKMPLYLAASGHGDLIRFQALASELNDVCDFYMLQPPTSSPFTRIEELAQRYADQINHYGRPGFLAGFSVGGIAALEAARMLELSGMTLPGVILVDTVFPSRMLRGTLLWRSLGWLARRLNAQELSMNGRHLGAMFSDPGLIAQIEAISTYKPEAYEKSVLLIKSTGLIKWARLLFTPWRKYLKTNLREIEISGLHGSIFEQQGIQELASVLRQEIQAKQNSAMHDEQ